MRTLFLPLVFALTLASTAARAALAHPQLTALTRESPATVSSGGKVEFRFNVSPGTAPTRRVELTVSTPGGIRGVRVLGTGDPRTGVISTTIDSSWLNGRYEVANVILIDDWSRTVTFGSDGKISEEHRVNPDEVYYTGPATHGIEFAPLAFTVTDASAVAPRPELTAITALSTNPLTPGQTARFRYTITPGLVPLAKVGMSFRHTTAVSAVLLAPTTETNELNGEIALPIPGTVMNGRYRLASVTLTDAQGRQTVYGTFGRVTESWETTGGGGSDAESSTIQIQTIEFAVEGASASVTPPRFTAWSRQGPVEATPGATVSFTYDTATAGYPIRQVFLRLGGPFGATRDILTTSGNGTFTFPVTADWVSGPYTVRVVTLTDEAGRTISLLPFGGTVVGSIGQLPAPSEQFAFNVQGLTVPPYFNLQPAEETRVLSGTSVSFFARGVGLGPVTYQWYRGEPGDTRFPISSSQNDPRQFGAQVQQSTTFWVRITSAGATADSNAARVVIIAASDLGRLINLSVLTSLDSPTDEFTLGYVVGGNGTSGTKPLVLRAAGPSLGALGVPGTLNDPTMEIFAGANRTGANDNWGGGAEVAAAMSAVGAFPYTGPTSRDAAVTTSLTTRDNSMRVTGVGGSTGLVIAEVYDATPSLAFAAATPRLLNVSVRKHIGTGLTAGFVIGGLTNVRVLIRVVGPGLVPFGVSDTVADPQLTLFRGTTPIGANDDWASALDVIMEGSRVGAFALPANSRDAALVATLQPGSYNVRATGVNGTTGVALVEVYQLP